MSAFSSPSAHFLMSAELLALLCIGWTTLTLNTNVLADSASLVQEPFYELNLLEHTKTISETHFEPACDLHDGKRGFVTQARDLPQPAEDGWLYPSKEEIKKWYDIGMQECEAYLKSTNAVWKTNISPYYVNQDNVPSQGLGTCRGRDTLHSLANVTVYPFGPIKECPTYSKCWFGLLTCGHANDANIEKSVAGHIESFLKSHTLDIHKGKYKGWSIKSLNLLMRVVGPELVVPEQRVVTIKRTSRSISSSSSSRTSNIDINSQNGGAGSNNTEYKSIAKEEDETVAALDVDEDVIIAQYHLTSPGLDYEIEVRLMELYPAVLYTWPEEYSSKYAIENAANIFLGGSEGRCKRWVHCTYHLKNTCCGCDERSFIVPQKLIVESVAAIVRCYNLQGPAAQQLNLPICAPTSSNYPGRWIQSSAKEYGAGRCKKTTGSGPDTNGASANTFYNFNELNTVHPRQPAPKPQQPKVQHIKTTGAKVTRRHRALTGSGSKHAGLNSSKYNQIIDIEEIEYTDKQWVKYAGGDPCMVEERLPTAEERNTGLWFFAPYSCKYQFYQRSDLYKCFKALDIKNIHFHGDSMSRELFTWVSTYLGFKVDDMKRLTNELHKNQISFTANGVTLSEGYTWAFDDRVSAIIESPPYPDVYVTNNMLAHNHMHMFKFAKHFQNTEAKYWRVNYTRSELPLPRYRFFQNARELTGKREQLDDGTYAGNLYRMNSEYMRQYYVKELGFIELDEYLFSKGRYDFFKPANDGWHFRGTKRIMEAVALFNMICNDWFINSTRADWHAKVAKSPTTTTTTSSSSKKGQHL